MGDVVESGAFARKEGIIMFSRYFVETMRWHYFSPFKTFFVLGNNMQGYYQAIRDWKAWKPPRYKTVKEWRERRNNE